jgi:protein phosphatase
LKRVGTGISLVFSDRSDIGRRRSNNQDSKAVVPPVSAEHYGSRGWLFLVADGMGAHAAGELASAIAAEQVPLVYAKTPDRPPPLALRKAIEQINAEIHARGESMPEFRGMGTTCTTLVLVPQGAVIGHVGDSRAYRMRGNSIDQLTRDHSLVWELEAAGGLPRGPTASAIPKNIITRSMGPHAAVDVDLEGPFPVAQGDLFLLCSDGLSGQVSDEEIGLFAAGLEPAEATAALVGLALVRGGPDNITVILARAGSQEATPPAGADAIEITSSHPARQAAVPWHWLVAAAVSLFAALLLSPSSELTRSASAGMQTLMSVACAGLVLLAVGLALIASLNAFLPWGRQERLLAPGERFGRGPYRTYDCTPRAGLLEGVIASIESAADGLAPPDCDRTLAILARARRHAAAGAFPAALQACCEAIAIYSRTVEAARSGETVRVAPPDAPSPPPSTA